MSNCAVGNCKNYTRVTKRSNIKYFRFPKDANLTKQWVIACRREDKVNLKNELSEDFVLQQLKEIDAETNDAVANENEVITFRLKYLGSTVVEKVSGENISTEAVKNIVKTIKATKGRKKIQRTDVNISPKGIAVTDVQGNDILKISIYRISNCSTDSTHRQIFSFISTDSNETMECHAFLCAKRKLAETVTLAVAHAFSKAYKEWQLSPAAKEIGNYTAKCEDSQKNAINQLEIVDGGREENVVEEKLIDLDSDGGFDDMFGTETSPSQKNNHWVCFDDDFGGESPSKPTPYHQVDLILV